MPISKIAVMPEFIGILYFAMPVVITGGLLILWFIKRQRSLIKKNKK